MNENIVCTNPRAVSIWDFMFTISPRPDHGDYRWRTASGRTGIVDNYLLQSFFENFDKWLESKGISADT